MLHTVLYTSYWPSVMLRGPLELRDYCGTKRKTAGKLTSLATFSLCGM